MPHSHVLVEGNAHRVESLDVRCQPVDRLLILQLEAAKHSVPDDQHAAVVAVEVEVVGAVVDAVVRGRVEDELDRPWEAMDPFGVKKELVDQADRLHREDHSRLVAEQRQRRPERDCRDRHPRLAQRRREVVMLA